MIAPLLAALADGFAVVLVLALLAAVAAGATAYLLNPAAPFPQPVTCWLQRFLGIPNEKQGQEGNSLAGQTAPLRIQDELIYLDCSLSTLLECQWLLLTPASPPSSD